MERVLVLNQSYEPINIINWQKAVTLLTCDKVEVIREYDQDIRSTYLVIKMPAVIRFLSKFRRPRQKVKFNKQNVFARDKWKCSYCYKTFSSAELTYDHVVPKSHKNSPGTCWENITSACGPCNIKKGNRTPKKAGMRLRKIPIEPDWVPVFAIRISNADGVPEHWRSFLYYGPHT